MDTELIFLKTWLLLRKYRIRYQPGFSDLQPKEPEILFGAEGAGDNY